MLSLAAQGSLQLLRALLSCPGLSSAPQGSLSCPGRCSAAQGSHQLPRALFSSSRLSSATQGSLQLLRTLFICSGLSSAAQGSPQLLRALFICSGLSSSAQGSPQLPRALLSWRLTDVFRRVSSERPFNESVAGVVSHPLLKLPQGKNTNREVDVGTHTQSAAE